MKVVVGDARSLIVKIDTHGLEQAMREAPRSVYFWMHDFLKRSFESHRKQWIWRKRTTYGSPKFGRGTAPDSIRIREINEGSLVPAPNEVVYHVLPQEERMPTGKAASVALRALQGRATTGNVVLRIHEIGEDIQSSGKLMSIPVKTRPGTPKKWRAKYPGKDLVLRPSKKGTADLLLYEVIRSRGRGRPRKDGTGATIHERLRLRFLLTRFIDFKPTLHMMDTWTSLEGERDKLFANRATKIARDILQGRGD